MNRISRATLKMDENYIRRERQRKEEIKNTVAEMRAALKVCTMDDVRRHKMPYDRALLIGLEEQGYFITSSLIRQMIDFQTDMMEKAGPSSILWTKPQLRENKNILTTLSEELVKAENYHRNHEYAKKCETFIKVASHLAYLHTDWWWLGEQMLLHCISVSKEHPELEGKYEALSRYGYAKFLLENIKEADTAQEHLTIVRELSQGKKWSTYCVFPDEKDYLYTRANYLLHTCLMQKARYYMKIDRDMAIKLASLARKRAAEACYLDGETRALLLKGICELAASHASSAIASFSRAFYIQQRLGNLEGICTTQLHLAQAYMVNGDTLLSLKTLVSSRECAEHNNLAYFLAQAYKHLGEFYLNNGEPKKATPLLGEALKILHETDNIHESEQVRNLEAISTGLELFPRYLKLLTDTGHPETGLQSLMKMIDWKDSRKQFWSQDDESNDPSPQVSDDDVKVDESLMQENVARSYPQKETHKKKFAHKEEVVELHTNIEAFQPDSNTEVAINENETDINEAAQTSNQVQD